MRADSYLTSSNIDIKAQEWVALVREQTAPRPHLSPKPGKCALIVVDMNRYFTSAEGACFLPAGETIIPGIARLLAAWRGAGHTVVFTRHGHIGTADLGMLGRFFSDHIDADSEDAQIVSRLTPRGAEKIVEKTTYDAFLNTDLESYLHGEKITQVLITGVLSHMCCETTARSAFCRGFEVFVTVDGMATTNEDRHLGTLLALADAVAVPYRVKEIEDLWRCDR